MAQAQIPDSQIQTKPVSASVALNEPLLSVITTAAEKLVHLQRNLKTISSLNEA